jgi:hypothetical protein
MYAASALAGNTIARSAMAAAAPLYTQQMFSALGVGVAGSIIGAVASLLAVIPFLVRILTTQYEPGPKVDMLTCYGHSSIDMAPGSDTNPDLRRPMIPLRLIRVVVLVYPQRLRNRNTRQKVMRSGASMKWQVLLMAWSRRNISRRRNQGGAVEAIRTSTPMAWRKPNDEGELRYHDD